MLVDDRAACDAPAWDDVRTGPRLQHAAAARARAALRSGDRLRIAAAVRQLDRARAAERRSSCSRRGRALDALRRHANVVAYVPFGFFVALLPRRASPLAADRRSARSRAVALSFAMETLQMFLPPRARARSTCCRTPPARCWAASLGAALARADGVKRVDRAIARAAVPAADTLGDVGLALLALWLVAQINPGIPLFAVTFDPRVPGASLVAAADADREGAALADRGGRKRVPAARRRAVPRAAAARAPPRRRAACCC